MKSAPQNWEILSDKVMARYHICEVCEREAKHPDGRKGNFFVMKSPDWVQALAITPNHELIMVKQFRIGSQTICLEAPGGILEPGEDPTVGAMRELQEETGFIGRNPLVLASCYPNPALQTNKVHYILFKDCEATGKTHWDMYEELQTQLIPFNELEKLIQNGAIDHCITIGGLFFLKRYLSLSFLPNRFSAKGNPSYSSAKG